MAPAGDQKRIGTWLTIVAGLIASMILVGGLTRLTGSGLSITEWQPITGALPPLHDRDWQELFEKYRSSPQYRLANGGFTLSDFQAIFWWEWAHRLLGRFIGLAFAIPLAIFWRRKSLAPWLMRRCVLLLGLGAFQGLLGWLMVKSGLVSIPQVSHFRLAAHLGVALLTLSITLWTIFELRAGRSKLERAPRELKLFAGALALQLAWGAFVAGLKAGYLYPTFPKMGEQWFPSSLSSPGPFAEPLSHAMMNDPVLVQFIHRWWGALVLVQGLAAAKKISTVRRGHALALAGATFSQFGLGVLAILCFYRLPVVYGGLHQLGAVLLVAVTVAALYETSKADVLASVDRSAQTRADASLPIA